MRVTRFVLFFFIILAATVSAQSSPPWESSGNGLLAGTFNFRQVAWFVSDASGNFNPRFINEAVTLYGNITFDGLRDVNGNGHYSLTASTFDSSVGVLQQFSTSGTYRISASGLGFLTNPIFTSGGAVWGTVSNGIFIGSSTEDAVNDLFVAAKTPTTVPTVANFSGSYAIAEMNFPSLSLSTVRDAMFQMNPDGTGSLGTLNATGYIGNGNTAVTQTVTGARYSFNGTGLGTLTFGGTLTNQNLLAGSRLFYMSPDKRFVFGGSISGFDLFVGVLAPPTTTAPPNLLSGLYYQAGVDENLANLSAGASNLSSYFGSFQATAGTIVGHQRLLTGFNGSLANYNAFDYTYSDTLLVNTDGTQNDFFGQHHVIGAGGDIRVGIGQGVVPGINVALRAPTFTGGGVFLSPTGAVNWFSSAPFSVGVSPGAFVALSGTGLANVTMTDPTIPFNLGNVQVVVNDRAAPIYRVSPTSIIFVVPYATSGTVASVKVINNGVGSETRTFFATQTTPGVLADNGGAGHVIAQHLDFSLVTTANPARPGEIILFYVAGLGAVNPAIADGVPAPLAPLSTVVANLAATVDGVQTPIIFAGLTPTLIADYAFITTIPPGTVPGDAFLNIAGPDSLTSEATVPVGNTILVSQSESEGEMVAAQAEQVRGPREARPPHVIPQIESAQSAGAPVMVATPWGGAVPTRRIDTDTLTGR